MVKIDKISYDRDCCVTPDSKDEESYYPYGTCLNIENELFDKLKLDGLKPGDIVEVRGFATVESIGQDANREKSNKRISMQMTEINVAPKKGDVASQMYGD